MFLFQNILTFITNYNLNLEYNNYEKDYEICNCNLCYMMDKYISPIIYFIYFELKIKN
jgi:hypothetical protein